MPQVVCFTVGPYRCALDIMRVREVIPARPAAPMPGTGPSVDGVVELRGVLLPVVDLRRRLGAPADAPPAKYVVATAGGASVALSVDAVQDVRRWDAAAIQPPPAAIDTRSVAGVVTTDDGVILLLDLDRLLDPAEPIGNLPV
jgi:purine-binding chemotaxis protein CheW